MTAAILMLIAHLFIFAFTWFRLSRKSRRLQREASAKTIEIEQLKGQNRYWQREFNSLQVENERLKVKAN